jgi:hypothetical protein
MTQKRSRYLIPVILVSIGALGELYGLYRKCYRARLTHHA